MKYYRMLSGITAPISITLAFVKVSDAGTSPGSPSDSGDR